MPTTISTPRNCFPEAISHTCFSLAFQSPYIYLQIISLTGLYKAAIRLCIALDKPEKIIHKIAIQRGSVASTRQQSGSLVD